MSVTIRPARPDDLEFLRSLAAQFSEEVGLNYSWDSSSALIRDLMASDQATVLVAALANDYEPLVGAIAGILTSAPLLGHSVAQEMFWYSDRSASRSAGVRLLAAFEQWALDHDCHSVVMATLPGTPDGVAEYLGRRGYAVLETQYIRELKQ